MPRRIALIFVLLIFSLSTAKAWDFHETQNELKVLTYNAWLLDVPMFPFGFRSDISQDMNARLKEMPSALAKTGADIIVMQEVWSDQSKRALIEAMKRWGYLYSAYTHISDWFLIFQVQMGDGLLVLSKFPISKRAEKMDFSVATQSIEKFAQKGALHLEIRHPALGWMDVFAAHAGAIDFKNGEYDSHQKLKLKQQLKELAAWIQKSRRHSVTLLAADLNLHYQKWNHGFMKEYADEYQDLLKHSCGNGPLVNTYLEANRKTQNDTADFTFSQKNPYAQTGYFESLPDEMEDYVFFCKNDALSVNDSKIVLNQASDSVHAKLLSDHFGVLSTLVPNPVPVIQSMPLVNN